MPATRQRWSSSRRRSVQSDHQRQMPAVVDGVGVGRGRVLVAEHPLLEAALDHPVVGAVVGEAVRVHLAVAGDHVDVLRRHPLQGLQPVGVRAQLEERRRLHALRELGVGGLVAPGPEGARPLDPHEEVGVAPPAAVPEQGALVDDGDALAHRGQRLRSALSSVSRVKPACWISRTVRPSASRRSRQRVSCSKPRFCSSFELRVLGVVGLLARLLGHLQVEHREVLAAEEPHEVVGADDQAAVESLHRAPASEAGVHRPPADRLTGTTMRSFISQLRARARLSRLRAKMLSDNGLRGLMRTNQATWVSRFRTFAVHSP